MLVGSPGAAFELVFPNPSVNANFPSFLLHYQFIAPHRRPTRMRALGRAGLELAQPEDSHFAFFEISLELDDLELFVLEEAEVSLATLPQLPVFHFELRESIEQATDRIALHMILSKMEE